MFALIVASRVPAALTSTTTGPFPAEAANISGVDFLPVEGVRDHSDQRVVKDRYGSVNVLRD